MSSPGPRHLRPTKLKTFLFGAPYYPEHWSEQDRADDPVRMAAAGVNVVRMGEFAWDRMEPTQGNYDFSFFDEQIARLGRLGVKTIFCTPTATPPVWLVRKHPEMRRVDIDGRVMDHGTRQHCCTTNALFRQHSRRITAALAEHYAGNADVIGWQTDNELNCHFALCYCPACQDAFREWCRQKYQGDIAALNAAWGCAFWALTFNDFSQIGLPIPRPAQANPGQVLDYHRFVSDMVVRFQREQVEILRQAQPEWFITHNGLMGYIDYTPFTADLDFLGVDIYPGFDMSPATVSALADRARCFGGNFIVPELQSGPGGQVTFLTPTPPPGQMRLWAYQCIARGADGVLHFRWRSCRFGAEEYWCGVLDHDNRPRRRYEEFSREGNELRHFGGEFLGTVVHIDAGVLVSYQQEQAHAADHLGMPGPRDQGQVAHRALWERKIAVGCVEETDSFDGLKLLVLPSFIMLDEALATRLTAFVRNGGTLVATAWTGTRDIANRIVPLSAPGLLADLMGVTVEEFGKLRDGENAIKLPDGTSVEPRMWYEMLFAGEAQVVGTWAKAHFAGTPAITQRQVGKGTAMYVGTYLSQGNAGAIMEMAIQRAGLKPVLPGLPEPVEATRRVASDREFLFLLNHSDQPQEVSYVPAGTDLLTGAAITGTLTLPPREVAVVKLTR